MPWNSSAARRRGYLRKKERERRAPERVPTPPPVGPWNVADFVRGLLHPLREKLVASPSAAPALQAFRTGLPPWMGWAGGGTGVAEGPVPLAARAPVAPGTWMVQAVPVPVPVVLQSHHVLNPLYVTPRVMHNAFDSPIPLCRQSPVHTLIPERLFGGCGDHPWRDGFVT